jgi:hypothetical protein
LTAPSTAAASVGRGAKQWHQRPDVQPAASMISNQCFVINFAPLVTVAQRTWVDIYELVTMRHILRFSAEHAVKRSAVAFVGKHLGVLTDLGCISLYALD